MIYNNYLEIKAEIGDVNLLAVSKTRSVEEMMVLYNNGIKEFGENRIEEMKEKCLVMPSDIYWHFIGRIQTKKIKNIVKYASLIHSVDCFKTLDNINEEAKKINKVQDILIQLNVSGEDSKSGFSSFELDDVMKYVSCLENVSVKGLMTMAPFTDDEAILNNVFAKMKESYDNYDFAILSMGMSNDYTLAISHGANLVRVGTKIFGKRD